MDTKRDGLRPIVRTAPWIPPGWIVMVGANAVLRSPEGKVFAVDLDTFGLLAKVAQDRFEAALTEAVEAAGRTGPKAEGG